MTKRVEIHTDDEALYVDISGYAFWNEAKTRKDRREKDAIFKAKFEEVVSSIMREVGYAFDVRLCNIKVKNVRD